MASDQQKINPPTAPSIEDSYKVLGIKPNPDGTLTRINYVPNIFPNDIDYKISTEIKNNPEQQVSLSFDLLNPTPNVAFIRLFRPLKTPPDTNKLPLIIYFHAGGFVLSSAATLFTHESCEQRAAQIPAVIASVEYRLAPEHRLPAAYDDAVDTILWVKSQALSNDDSCHPWMKEFVDFSRVFLMGDSSGGNIVYHALLRAMDLDLEPVKIVGMILNQAAFGGVERTESELRYADNHVIPLHAADLLWSLSLPEGADRGHEYCNPFGRGSHDEKIGRLPMSLLRGYTGDPLIDRQKEFAKMLEARGVHVVTNFIDGGHHGVEIFEPTFAQVLYCDLKEFIASVPVVN